jgi:hypothetical protein
MPARLDDFRPLRRAIEASWDAATAYRGQTAHGRPALGQCYPTSWVAQQFHPEWEIARGTVEAADREHAHFWNVLPVHRGLFLHLDLTWAQFDAPARVCDVQILDRGDLGDSAATVARCHLLLGRVLNRLCEEHARGGLELASRNSAASPSNHRASHSQAADALYPNVTYNHGPIPRSG